MPSEVIQALAGRVIEDHLVDISLCCERAVGWGFRTTGRLRSNCLSKEFVPVVHYFVRGNKRILISLLHRLPPSIRPLFLVLMSVFKVEVTPSDRHY